MYKLKDNNNEIGGLLSMMALKSETAEIFRREMGCHKDVGIVKTNVASDSQIDCQYNCKMNILDYIEKEMETYASFMGLTLQELQCKLHILPRRFNMMKKSAWITKHDLLKALLISDLGYAESLATLEMFGHSLDIDNLNDRKLMLLLKRKHELKYQEQ